MSFALLPRVVRTASFGLAVLYTLLFAASGLILGVIVYLTVQAALDRQMASRIDAISFSVARAAASTAAISVGWWP